MRATKEAKEDHLDRLWKEARGKEGLQNKLSKGHRDWGLLGVVEPSSPSKPAASSVGRRAERTANRRKTGREGIDRSPPRHQRGTGQRRDQEGPSRAQSTVSPPGRSCRRTEKASRIQEQRNADLRGLLRARMRGRDSRRPAGSVRAARVACAKLGSEITPEVKARGSLPGEQLTPNVRREVFRSQGESPCRANHCTREPDPLRNAGRTASGQSKESRQKERGTPQREANRHTGR